MLIYRTAVPEDIPEIEQLVGAAVFEMERLQIHQWDALYPVHEDFEEDIRRHTMYVGMIDSEITVIFTLNQNCDDAYADAEWRYNGEAFAVLHRLCVLSAKQRQGIAGETLGYIETELKQRGYKAIRLDVFSENPYALRLYRHHGFQETGTADWRKGRFLLMEKLL